TSIFIILLCMLLPPLISTLFPYTTLFRSYRKLKAAGFRPWLDRREIGPGQQWTYAIERAIEESEFVLVCLSANSDSSIALSMARSEEHTSELQSLRHLVCRLLLEKKKTTP